MAVTEDALNLKVDSVKYMTLRNTVQGHMKNLRGILDEYRVLEGQISDIFGNDDEHVEELKKGIERNINAVQGLYVAVDEEDKMLQDQEERLGILSSSISENISQAKSAAQSAFKAIKAVSDVTDLIN